MKQWNFLTLPKNQANTTSRDTSPIMTQDESIHNLDNHMNDLNATQTDDIETKVSMRKNKTGDVGDDDNNECYKWNYTHNRGILAKRRLASTMYESFMQNAIDLIKSKQQRKTKKREILDRLKKKYTMEQNQIRQEHDDVKKDIVSYQKQVARMNPQIESLAQQIRLALAKVGIVYN